MADAAPPTPTERRSAIPMNHAFITQARMGRTRKLGIVELQIHVYGSSPEGSDLDLTPQLRWQPLEESAFLRGGEDKALMRWRGREGTFTNLGKNWRVWGKGWLRRLGAILNVAGAVNFVEKPFLELGHVCDVETKFARRVDQWGMQK